jgi:poly [ADP-ribose] polymerase
MDNANPIYLVMVTSDNHNKYYKMNPNGDYFNVEFGRIGNGGFQTATYPISQWNKKYNEKVKKGYTDQTRLVLDLLPRQDRKPRSEYKEIENNVVASIVSRLQSMARQAIKDNYTISSNKVTQAMIDEAQVVLTQLINENNVEKFNNTLIRLFEVIPRKMSRVSDYLANNERDFSKIIEKEQDLLDVMKGQVIQNKVDEDIEDNIEQNPKTILEVMELQFSECSTDDIEKIKNCLGSCRDKFYQAWKVTNNKTQDRFNNFIKDHNVNNIKLLWHGSRNENWWSIVNSGLVLKPTNAVITGKMFGYGIYFATKARKSLGYTSLNGSYWARGNSNTAFMALYNVAYGNPYNVHSFDSKYYDFTYEKLQKEQPRANCLHAHEGQMLRNDEIIVYKEEQTTIQYLVELK